MIQSEELTGHKVVAVNLTSTVSVNLTSTVSVNLTSTVASIRLCCLVVEASNSAHKEQIFLRI